MQQHPSSPPLIPPSDRDFWLQRRQALLVELGAIERALGLNRTVTPKHEQERRRFEQRRGGEGEG